MRLTERDRRIIAFLHDFEAADTDQLRRLFFPHQKQSKFLARKNLREIVEMEPDIKRDETGGRYVYYTNKKQLRHKLLITEFYIQLVNGPGAVLAYDRHPSFGKTRIVRPDMYVEYECRGMVYFMCLEVQISANPLNLEKYERWKLSGEYRPPFPWVVIVSWRDPKVKTSVMMKWLPVDFKGLYGIL